MLASRDVDGQPAGTARAALVTGLQNLEPHQNARRQTRGGGDRAFGRPGTGRDGGAEAAEVLTFQRHEGQHADAPRPDWSC